MLDRSLARVALCLFLLAAPAAALQAKPAAPERAQALEALAARLEARLAELNLPGLALGVVADDELVFARGLGLADVEGKKPVTPETLFAIGSTSKAFTATLVGMLADEGALSFDTPIGEVLPWFTPQVKGSGELPILRDLLAHRTGFVRMDMLWYGTGVEPDLVLRTAAKAEAYAPFRKEFHYNNVMYLAAGRACEEVTEKSWHELVRARFFEPLGMKSSSTSIAEAQRDPRLALGYTWDATAKRFEHAPMRELTAIAPAGAINSNVVDMARWVRCLLGKGELEGRRIVSAAALAETWKPHNKVGADSYGLGWFLRSWRGQPYVEHGGNIDGFAAQVSLLPESKLGVVMFANVSATPLQASIGPEVFAAVLDAAETPSAETAAEAQAAKAPAENLERFVGTYLANYYQFHDAKFEVLLREGKLAIDVPGQTTFALLPPDAAGRRAFELVPKEIQVDFLEEDGKPVELRLYQNGLRFDVPRAGYEPKADIDAAELEPYLGSYSDPVSGKTFAVVVSRGRLAVDYPDQMVYELLPPAGDERWVFRATERMAVEFHLDADDRAESLTFHERGTKRECERQGGPSALPALAELMELRRASAFESRLAELGLCRLTGTLRFVHAGIEGPITTTFDASGGSVEVVDLRPFLWTQSATDGEKARVRTSTAPEEALDGALRDHQRANALARFFGDWSRRFGSALVERVDVVGDRRTARVRLQLGEAPATIAHVDLATGDMVGAEVRVPSGDGSVATRTLTLEDWRDVEGLRLPMRMIGEDPGLGRVIVQYTRLETGLGRGPAPFALPAALEPR